MSPINNTFSRGVASTIRQRDAAKAEEYYLKASMNLANANAKAESGKKNQAERLYDRAQFWLDKANKAAGNS